MQKSSRLMVVLESPIRKWIEKKAKDADNSLSLTVRDLLREVYENQEDRYWGREGEKRLQALKGKTPVSHKDFWKKAGL